MKKFEALPFFHPSPLREVEVDRETETTVAICGVTQLKVARYFDTREEAIAHLTDAWRKRIDYAKKSIEGQKNLIKMLEGKIAHYESL